MKAASTDPSTITGEGIEDRLKWAMAGLLLLLSVGGVSIAFAFADNDPAREIGGALVAGAVVSGVVLVYSELAEKRRNQIDDDREDRFDERASGRASELDRQSQARAFRVIEREDRLRVWQAIDEVLLIDMSRTLPLSGELEWDDQQKINEAGATRLNQALVRLRVTGKKTLIPLLRRVEAHDLIDKVSKTFGNVQDFVHSNVSRRFPPS